MKRFLIMAFKTYGIFICNEVPQPTGEVFLIGKFDGKGGEYSFIKHPNDIEL
jgi:hypothetical protein